MLYRRYAAQDSVKRVRVLTGTLTFVICQKYAAGVRLLCASNSVAISRICIECFLNLAQKTIYPNCYGYRPRWAHFIHS
jgi:hypothetical protein